MRRAIAVSLLLLTFLTGCAAKPAPNAPTPTVDPAGGDPVRDSFLASLKPEQVTVVRYLPGGPPGGGLRRPLFGARAGDRARIAGLLHDLAAAPAMDATGADGEHRRVSWLEVALTDGRTVRVRDAWNCTPQDGGVSCQTVKGKQLIVDTEGQRTVVASPGLERFLHAEFDQVMPPEEQLKVEPRDLPVGGQLTVEGHASSSGTGYEIALMIGAERYVLDRGGLEFGDFAWSGHLPADLPPGEYELHVDVHDGGTTVLMLHVTR